ncbi:MAG TPA: hypothetical protein DCL08_03840 [Anaerolineaceae bacterium]|nr:hypothetical protein [Anaerolineaceae bacterium]
MEKDLFVIWLFCHLKNATYTNVFKLVTKFTPKTAKFTPLTPRKQGELKLGNLFTIICHTISKYDFQTTLMYASTPNGIRYQL